MKSTFKILLGMMTSLLLASCTTETVTVSYEEYPAAFRNPMKGFREFFAPGIDRKRADYPYPYGSMIKEYMQWNMLENKASDGVDKIIAYSDHRWEGVEDQNIKVIPRVFLVWLEPWHGGLARFTMTQHPDDIVGWHWPEDIPGETGPYKQIPNSVGAYVEEGDALTPIQGGYFDPSFPERVTRLVEKLGQAWDNDPRVAYVEMGIIGEWGEHHDPDISTYWPPHDEPEHVANRTWLPGIEKVLGDAFTKAFKNKKVMVRYAYEFKDYEFGIYWDSWSQPQEIDRGYNEMKKLGDRWKTQPIGGEITWNWGDLNRFHSFEEVVADDSTRSYVMEQIRNLHCNHLGGISWANFNDPVFQKNADELQQAMGYRFVIDNFTYETALETGKEAGISFTVRNTGSSPFYYDWPVEIALLDTCTHEKVWGQVLEDVQISSWMPGDEWSEVDYKYMVPAPANKISSRIKLDAALEKGKYILALSVLDPSGMKPSLRFANINYFTGGYHPMGYVGVNGENVSAYELPASIFDDIQEDRTLSYEGRKDKPVNVVLDTDVGNDIDDVLAMEMLFNYEKAGIIDLKGISLSKCNPSTIAFADAYCRMHGRGDMPLGYAYYGPNPQKSGYTDGTLDTLINGKHILHPERTIDSRIPEGYKMLRKTLAAAEDHSIVFIAVGPETNLSRLLDSPADEFSPLTGKELVAKKVRLLSVMGGLYGNEFDFPEWNIVQDLEASRKVFAEWPTPLFASGWELGNKLLYPHQSVLNDFSPEHPLRVAYQLYGEMPYDRQTWDLTSVLQAIEPDKSHFELSEPGTISIDEKGFSRFTPSPDGKHQYLKISGQEQIDKTLQSLVRQVANK